MPNKLYLMVWDVDGMEVALTREAENPDDCFQDLDAKALADPSVHLKLIQEVEPI